MKKKIIKGVEYFEDALGILIPSSLIIKKGTKVRSPSDVVPFLSEERVFQQEQAIVVTLDGNNQIISKHAVTKGLINACQMHPRELFRCAILDNAVSIILAHNHPSGNLEPSLDDIASTRRMSEAAKIIGISLLDHLIISSDGFKSIRESYPNFFCNQQA